FVDAAGKEVQPGEPIALWHPVDRSAAERDAWSVCGLDTPFKQVDRETYTLPEGELTTAQFAGRRVPQHQFHALCRERGWGFRLQGEFDSINDAVLMLPKWGLTAQLEVAPSPASGASGMGIYLEVETGALTFTTPGPVPERVFSEVIQN